MNLAQAIADRRSIRRFKDSPVPREHIEAILHVATLAPSGKNKQPWHFTVLEGTKKHEVVDIMETSVRNMQEQGHQTGSAEGTAKIMRQAPVCIFIHNPYFTPEEDHNGINRYFSLVDTQSVGAAIQNMLLKAEELGLGTLWICDVFFAEGKLNEYLGRSDEMIAAVSIGYADESPAPRPRKSWQEVTTWL